jgi:hypothetical protein
MDSSSLGAGNLFRFVYCPKPPAGFSFLPYSSLAARFAF